MEKAPPSDIAQFARDNCLAVPLTALGCVAD